VIIGDDAVMIIDATATPVMAQDVVRHVRQVTDKPIKYVTLTHYHAVRVLGASGYKPHGLQEIIASRPTYELIVERGQQDMDSEIGRFPRLFNAVESVPGLTWPSVVVDGELTLWMGDLEVKIWHPGRGHTKGDTVVWLPQQKILFSGDLVEADAACYTGDAYLADWPATLDKLAALKPEKLIPGRGPALMDRRNRCSAAWPIRAISSRRSTLAPRRPWRRAWTWPPAWRTRARPWTRSSARSSSTSTACLST
jgi:glyoxylase-like metal-dependent hydrolase (beta-lactamase superfamily II)